MQRLLVRAVVGVLVFVVVRVEDKRVVGFDVRELVVRVVVGDVVGVNVLVVMGVVLRVVVRSGVEWRCAAAAAVGGHSQARKMQTTLRARKW